MTCPDDNVLATLVDGTIADDDRVALERHLDGCEVCTKLVGELAWVVAPTRAAPKGYRLVRAVDETTWEAVDTRTDRRVALSFGACDARIADVRNASVVRAYEAGTADGEAFVACELVTTTERVWRGRHSQDAILGVWRQALVGVAALHRAGVVHGQLSPDHVFVEPDGRVLVGAFAAVNDKPYRSPEQLAGQPATTRSDQFSACVSIFEALTNRKPFSGATAGALAVAMASPPEPPAALDRHIYTTLVRGLAHDPARRWPDVEALATALERPQRSRAAMTLVGVALIAAAIAIGLLAR